MSAAGANGQQPSLAAQIRESTASHYVETVLKTDEQVIARVTDGIYRQPASALRELISNAYDADATRVVIKTDAPRFERITVEDDGRGMTPEVLEHLLEHIGGSAKRNQTGAELGITEHDDPTRSPKGRRLIGKIGIGLFSVSQLTHSFQIVTKVKDDPYRTIATVALRQFSDFKAKAPDGRETQFESGKVKIWRTKASDKAAHGTTIALTAIRPQARDTLRSRDIWSAIEHNEQVASPDDRQTIEPPKFHIGRVDTSGQLLQRTGGKQTNLPWGRSDKPDAAFKKMVDCVWEEVLGSNPNPRLERLFDYYLRMVWQIALAVPLPYVEGHLFDQPTSGWASVFELSNKVRGSTKRVEPKPPVKIRQALSLSDPKDDPGKFEIIFDDLKLKRPIRFRKLPTTDHALKHPLVFIGKCSEKFSGVPPALSGGPLSFEAYLFWSPKIAPTEHQGSLIRIHGSSGTLFDPTFMRYQVSEQTRLRQTTCEIFVSEGLDSALNIDRESFNNAHPHSVFITKWLHNALTQLATAQKRAASEVREASRAQKTEERIDEIQQIAAEVWAEEADDEGSVPPPVELSETGEKTKPNADGYAFSRSVVLRKKPQTKTRGSRARDLVLEEKVKAIAQVLVSYELLDGLTKRKQEQLLNAIYKILDASEDA